MPETKGRGKALPIGGLPFFIFSKSTAVAILWTMRHCLCSLARSLSVAHATVAGRRIERAGVVSRIFRTFSLAERHPALAHAVMAPLICWSLSSSIRNCGQRERRLRHDRRRQEDRRSREHPTLAAACRCSQVGGSKTRAEEIRR